MAGMDIPPQLKNEIVQLQTIQQQIQMVEAQKQQIQAQITEIEKASHYLTEAKGDAPIYRSIGSLLVMSTKEEASKALVEQRELLDVRTKSFDTQVQRLRDRVNELQKRINDAIGGMQNAAGGDKAN